MSDKVTIQIFSERINLPDDGEPLLAVTEFPLERLNSHLCDFCDALIRRCARVRYPNLVRTAFDKKIRQRWYNDTRPRRTEIHCGGFDSMLLSATKSDCHLCALYLNKMRISASGILDMKKSTQSSPVIADVHILPTISSDSGLLELMLGFSLKLQDQQLGGMISGKLQFLPIDGQSGPETMPEVHFPPSFPKECTFSPGEPRTVESQKRIVCDWLDECMKSHDQCSALSRQLSSYREMPARLIEVGTMSDFSDLKLVLTSNTLASPRWVALSHCWGVEGISFTLNASNQTDLMGRIKFDKLPQNFKDAVEVTRCLSHRFGPLYLWIDALCIIQDSTKDWSKESAIMGHVYSKAICTIFACRGHDSSAGLFEETIRNSDHECIVNGGPSGSLAGHWRVLGSNQFCQSVTYSPLLSRAWVQQELNLSVRKIFFASGQLYWQCSQGRKQETDHESIMSDFSDLWTSGSYSFAAWDAIINPEDSQQLKGHGLWTKIIERHSACGITRTSDKLPSIASLAKGMENIFGFKDEYVVGMWKSLFWYYLLWRVLKRGNARPADNHSPSWSWTSVEGEVRFMLPITPSQTDKFQSLDSLLALVDLQIRPEQEDFLMGQVTSAVAKVRAAILELQLRVSLNGDGTNPVWGSFSAYEGRIAAESFIYVDYIEDWTHNGLSQVCVLVAASDHRQESRIGTEDTYCLLLKRVDRKVYKRVGILTIDQFSKESPWSKLTELFNDEAHLRSDQYYDESHGYGFYTITII